MTERVHPEIGTVDIIEVYEFFDEPVLFVARNERDDLFLVVLSGDGLQDRTWLFAPMSRRRFDEVRSGGIDLHDAFAAVEGGHVFRVTSSRTSNRAEVGVWVPAVQLTEQQLPLAGEKLDLPTETLGKRPDLDASLLAQQVRREVVTLRLEFSDTYRTEAPAGILGQLLDGFQQLVTAVGQTAMGRGTKRAPIPADIVGKMRLAVAGTFAGSFGVEIHSMDTADLYGDSPVGGALEHLTRLLEATPSDEALRAVIRDFGGGRSVSKYRDFLLRFAGGLEQVQITWGSPKPERSLRRFCLRRVDAERAVILLSDLKSDEPSEFEVAGRLIGLNVRTKTYELWDIDEGRKYSGRVVDEAMESIAHATINDVYLALIREERELSPTGEVETRYRLLRLEAPAPSAADVSRTKQK